MSRLSIGIVLSEALLVNVIESVCCGGKRIDYEHEQSRRHDRSLGLMGNRLNDMLRIRD